MNRESECKTVHVYPHFFSAPLLGNQSSSFKSSPSLLLSVMSCLSFSNERRQSNAIHWKETWIKTRRLRWFDERERERESRSLILVLDSSKDRIRQLFPFSFFLWSSFDSFLVPLKVFILCVLCLFLFFDDNDDVEVSLSDACWFECGLDVLLSFLCAFVLSLSKPFCFDSWSSFLCNTSCREETGEKGEIECPVRVKLE